MDDISELLLIKGITPEIYWGSKSTNHPVSAFQQHGGGPFGTTVNQGGPGFHSNDQPESHVGLYDLFTAMGGKLNINTAQIETMQLIPGIDQATAEHILEMRRGPDNQDGTDDDLPFQSPGEISSGLPGGGPGNISSGAPQTGVAAAGLANYVDVRSYVFQVKVVAEINDYKRTFYGIVSRAGGGGQSIKCVKFYWE